MKKVPLHNGFQPEIVSDFQNVNKKQNHRTKFRKIFSRVTKLKMDATISMTKKKVLLHNTVYLSI